MRRTSLCAYTCIFNFFFIKDNFHRNLASFKEKASGKKLLLWYSWISSINSIFFLPLYDLSESMFFEEEMWMPVLSDTKWLQWAAVCREAHCLENYQLWQSSTGLYFACEIGRILRSRCDKQELWYNQLVSFSGWLLAGCSQPGSVLSYILYGQRYISYIIWPERLRAFGSSGKNANLVWSFALLFVSCYLCVWPRYEDVKPHLVFYTLSRYHIAVSW